jgi:hypothetical protein
VHGLIEQINDAIGEGATLNVVGAATEAAPSYRFKIDDEAIPALWLELLHELETGVAPREIPGPVLNVLHNVFICVLLNLSEHVLKAVTLPAKGAEHSVIKLRVSGHCKAAMTRCALDLLASAAHESTPGSVGVGTANVPESEACR